MKRPFYVVGFSALAALALAGVLPLRAVLVLLAACVLGCAVSFCVRTERSVGVLRAVLLSASIALCLFVGTELLWYRPLLAFDGTHQTLQAEILEVRSASDGDAYYIARVQEGALPRGTQMYLYIQDATAFERRDSVQLTVELRAVEYGTSDDLFLRSAKADGRIFYAWQYGSFTVCGKAPPGWSSVLLDLRDGLVTRIGQSLSEESAALTSAVILGDKSGLSDETENAFRNSGITHLLVVSGLHMSMISGGLYWGLRRLHLSRRVTSLCALCGTCGFALLVGLSPSVLRALIFSAILLIGNCFRRRPDARNSLGFAMTVLLACNCYTVYDLGFLLSFGAAWGLIVLLPRAQQWTQAHVVDKVTDKLPRLRAPIRWLCESVCVTLCATAPILPLMMYVFGEISLISPLTNVLAVVPSTVLLWSGAGGLVLSLIWKPLGFPLWIITEGIAQYLLALTRWLGNGFGVLYVGEPYLLMTLYGCMALLLFGWWRLRGRGLRIAMPLSAVLLCAAMLLNVLVWNGRTELTACDANGHVAVLVRHEQSVGVIIDGSEMSCTAAREALLASGQRTPDFVLVVGAPSEQAGRLTHLALEFKEAAWVFTDAASVVASVLPQATRLPFGGVQTLHGEVRATALVDGFVRIECGEISLLYCPPKANALALSGEQRQATILLLADTYPAHVSALYAQAGFWFTRAEQELPQQSTYPVYAACEGVRLYARGTENVRCSIQPFATADDKA